MEEMNVEIVATSIIKPSPPTPDHLRLHKLSLVDQLFPSIYTSLLLYYSAPINNVAAERPSRLRRLKSSLSEILIHYYPFAGRITGNASVECTDDGVPFREADVDSCSLVEMLEKRDPDTVKRFLPVKGVFQEAGTIPLQIQATFFRCGGMALGVCASHKIMDGAALFSFVRSWASTASDDNNNTTILAPEFTISSLVPSSDLLNSITTGQQEMKPDNNCVTKIFVFTASSIAALKAKGDRDHDQHTRVQAVSAIIWKCAMKATKSTTISPKKSSIMLVAVNMRTRLDPPLPENSPGNFIGNFSVQKDYNQNVTDLGELMGKLKNGLKGFCDNYMKKLQFGKEGMSSVILESAMESRDIVMREDIDLFHNTSWCGFKFYDVDFGWGKPTWVSTASGSYDNVFVLIDTEDGNGVEAWVTLKKEDMAAFEQDQELELSKRAKPVGQSRPATRKGRFGLMKCKPGRATGKPPLD